MDKEGGPGPSRQEYGKEEEDDSRGNDPAEISEIKLQPSFSFAPTRRDALPRDSLRRGKHTAAGGKRERSGEKRNKTSERK